MDQRARQAALRARAIRDVEVARESVLRAHRCALDLGLSQESARLAKMADQLLMVQAGLVSARPLRLPAADPSP